MRLFHPNGFQVWPVSEDQANPTIGAENGIVTSVNDDLVGIPDEFILAQNYPNPFNPSTFINYTIPQSAILTNTRLEIFNVLGQKVRTLINSRQSAGAHSVQWDGRDDAGRLLVSGVFIYRLKMGNFVDMKKMLLVKIRKIFLIIVNNSAFFSNVGFRGVRGVTNSSGHGLIKRAVVPLITNVFFDKSKFNILPWEFLNQRPIQSL